MSFTHGKTTFVSINGSDISPYSSNTDWEKSADVHDVTGYGKLAHVFQGGLLNGKASVSGTYDDTVAGPHDIIQPLVGSTVAMVYRPEGTGTGKPQETVNVVVMSYKQSNPVADMVKWTCDFQLSDAVTSINQP